MLIQKNTFVIKQSSGFMRSFLYIDKVGIVERIFKRNGWSKYDLFIKNAHKNFAVTLSPDDQICIIFKDSQGNIFLTVYDNSEPITHQLYKNTDNDDIYFDAFSNGDYIHIFYTMLNTRTNTKMIFYQKIDREFRISTLDIIGRINFDYEQPFSCHNDRTGKVYVVFQRYRDGHHYLGYKMLDKERKTWTKYQRIDESSEPFVDFSLLGIKDKIMVAYIKKENGLDKIMCFEETECDEKSCEVFEGNNIESCSLFTRGDKVWCTWISEKGFYGVFKLLNERFFSCPPYQESIKPENTNKGIYLSNFPEEDSIFFNGELYIFNNSGPDYHGLPKLYNIDAKNKNTEGAFDGYISEQVLKKMERYAEEIKEKDRIIEELKLRIENLENAMKEVPPVFELFEGQNDGNEEIS